jgi:hypothetical protein
VPGGAWSSYPHLCCAGFLCTLIIANCIFSFIVCYSVEQDRRSTLLRKPVSLSGDTHVIIAKAMFGLPEDALLTINLGYLELVSVATVELDVHRLGNIGQG